MQCPVALNIKETSTRAWAYQTLAHELHLFSPQVAYWNELPHTLWIEATQNTVQGLSTTAFVARLINHLDGLGYHSSAVWGCAPYAAALLAQSAPCNRYMMVKTKHQNGAIGSLPIQVLNLGSEAEQSLHRLGLRSLRDLKRIPRHDLESRYGSALKVRLRMLSGKTPDWRIIKPQKIQVEPLIIEDEISHLESLLFLTKSRVEQRLTGLAAQGLACYQFILSAKTRNDATLTWAVHPTRPSLDAHWFIELLRLKLEHTHLKSPIQEAWIELKAQPAHQHQLNLFNTAKRDPKTSDEALDRLRAEFGKNLIFTARTLPRHHPRDAGVWVAHHGRWPHAQSVPKRKSWVRRLLRTPRRVDGPQPDKPWFLCGELAVDIGGPYPIEQRWWSTKETEDEYLVRVQSGRIFWLLCDQHTNLWRVIGWVA